MHYKNRTPFEAVAQVRVGIYVWGSIRTELLQPGNRNVDFSTAISLNTYLCFIFLHSQRKLVFYPGGCSTSIACEIKSICIMHGD